MAIKKGLGRGIEALFEDSGDTKDVTSGITELKISQVEPNRNQPRKDFDKDALAELASSIETHGVISPIIVRPSDNGQYQIIAGERRWRASRMAGLDTVPVIIKDFDEKEVMEVALIENLQREDLNPVEEAMGYRALMDTFGMTQEQVAQRVGKSRSAIANALRLLTLRPQELELLRNGKITAGHARALLAAADALTREQMAEMAANGASVHELERIARASHRRKTNREPSLSGSG
ncbi:MAG: ParB/RepB/Spo0J family partition protein, partial [Clostridia bacterium]|nr:ParB/RepB/Spo0J family partition protein [Clostridia bacterium]